MKLQAIGQGGGRGAGSAARTAFIVIFASSLVTGLVATPDPAPARTWLVHEDGTGDAPTIQAGVDSAAAGDSVLVTAGTYTDLFLDAVGDYSCVNMKSGVTLLSATGPELTVLDATSTDVSRGITCIGCDETTRIEGFTITGGDGFNGAAIYVSGGAPRIHGNILFDAYGGAGGAMYVAAGATPEISGNLFDANVACCGVGGAILVEGAASPRILDNEFRANSGFGGGAVAFFFASGLVEGNTFIENTGTDGGAILVRSSTPRLSDNVFTGNHSATGGGAVQFSFGGNAEFHNNLVTDNVADGWGGGLRIDNSSPEIVGTTIAGNAATSAGGVFITGDSSPLFDRVIVAFNQGLGGFHCDDPTSTPTLTCSDLFGNEGGELMGYCDDQLGVDGNISEDPLFCTESYELHELSPCVEGYGCGQIGALGVGCSGSTSAVESSTWGSIKALYR